MSELLSIQSPRGRLTVEFSWQGDRYAHRVIDTFGKALASVEGTPEEVWPSSPPIQQLSLESIDGQPVLLGVGAAGSGHWSISVSGVEHDGSEAFKFELACRSRNSPTTLSSTYNGERDGPRVVPQSTATLAKMPAGHVVVSTEVIAGTQTNQWSYLVS